jgi:acetyl-CoA synthetase
LCLRTSPVRVAAHDTGNPDAGSRARRWCAFVVPHEGVDGEAAVEGLREALTAALGRAMAPRAVHVVAALPETRNGEVLRRVAHASSLRTAPGDLSSLEDAAVLAR